MGNYTTHSFSVELATKIGLREAIILQHLYWWHQHNEALQRMNIDGRVWFFLPASQIAEVFPYLSEKVVRGIIDKLITEGYIIKDHKGEGQERFNRTNWYSLTDSALVFFHLPKWENGNTQTGKSIVNNNSYNISPNGENINISITPTPKKFDFRAALLGLGVEPELADTWLQVRKAKRAINTEVAFKGLRREIEKAGIPAADCIRIAVERSWSGFRAEWLEEKRASPAHRRRTTVTEDLLALGREMFGEQNNFYDEQ